MLWPFAWISLELTLTSCSTTPTTARASMSPRRSTRPRRVPTALSRSRASETMGSDSAARRRARDDAAAREGVAADGQRLDSACDRPIRTRRVSAELVHEEPGAWTHPADA